MAYSPSLARIDGLLQQAPAAIPQAPPSAAAYTPTLARVDALMATNAPPAATPATPPTSPANSSGFWDKFDQYRNSTAKHGAAILGSFGRDLINTPNKIYSKIPAYNEDFDYYKAMGVEKGFTDEVAEAGLNLAPYLTGVGGAAKLAATGAGKLSANAPKLAELFQKGVTSNLVKLPSASAIQGAVNAPEGERGMGALEGFGWGLAGWAGGKAGDAVLRKGMERYAQSAIPTLVSKATDKIKNYITPEQAAKTLQGNYTKAAGANTANWNRVTNLSSALDSQLAMQSRTFNTAPFANNLSRFYESTAKMEPAVRAKYEQALGFAKHIEGQMPQSFTGVVSLRQNLNQELKKYLEKNNIKATDTETTKLIKQLKDSLQETVEANKGNVDKGILSKFSSAWENANQSHAGLQEFYKAPNPSVIKLVRQRREGLQKGLTDRAALKQYARLSSEGNIGINHLNKLTGSDDAARSYLMRNVIEGRGKPNAALTAYEKLSVPQREALFARRPEGEALKAASYARNTVGNLPERKQWGGSLGRHAGMVGVPGGLTFLSALVAGKNWEDAAKLGTTVGLATGAPGAISRLAGRTAATPASVIRAVNRSQTAGRNPGLILTPALQALFPPRKEKDK